MNPEPECDDVLTEKERERFAKRAENTVLYRLSMRAHSQGELATVLARKQIPQDIAEATLAKVAEMGLVDDQAFATEWAEYRYRSTGLAASAIRYELIRKGVDIETINSALEAITRDEEEIRARQLVEKKLRTMTTLSRDVQTRRLVGLLARKGYSASLAYTLVREILDTPN